MKKPCLVNNGGKSIFAYWPNSFWGKKSLYHYFKWQRERCFIHLHGCLNKWTALFEYKFVCFIQQRVLFFKRSTSVDLCFSSLAFLLLSLWKLCYRVKPAWQEGTAPLSQKASMVWPGFLHHNKGAVIHEDYKNETTCNHINWHTSKCAFWTLNKQFHGTSCFHSRMVLSPTFYFLHKI